MVWGKGKKPFSRWDHVLKYVSDDRQLDTVLITNPPAKPRKIYPYFSNAPPSKCGTTANIYHTIEVYRSIKSSPVYGRTNILANDHRMSQIKTWNLKLMHLLPLLSIHFWTTVKSLRRHFDVVEKNSFRHTHCPILKIVSPSSLTIEDNVRSGRYPA